MYVIYKLTSPSGKSYVGQTNDFHRRMYEHTRPYAKCPGVVSAIKKYGWENFTKEILVKDISLHEANFWETNLITYHRTLSPHGYNLTTGGDGGQPWNKGIEGAQIPWNKGLKGVQTAWNKGKPMLPHVKKGLLNANLGTKHSDEHKRKIRETTKATYATEAVKRKVLNRKPITEETRKKLSEFQKNRPRKKETYEKISAALKGRKPSEATLQAAREFRAGKPAWNLGCKLTEEQRAKATNKRRETLLKKQLSQAIITQQ